MKKINILIAMFAVLLLTVSGFNESRFGSMPGDMAAPLNLSGVQGETTLDKFRGEYVLLSFWRSDDASSRAECNKAKAYSHAAARQGIDVKHVGINMADDRDLFDALVKADGLDANTQFTVDAKQAQSIRDAYNLDGNMGTLLIGKDGRVLAVNADRPTFERLTGLTNVTE